MTTLDTITASVVIALLSAAALWWGIDMSTEVEANTRVTVARLVVHNLQTAYVAGGKPAADELLARMATDTSDTAIRVCDFTYGDFGGACSVEVRMSATAITAFTTDNDGQPFTARASIAP